jgi:hypothetical protein
LTINASRRGKVLRKLVAAHPLALTMQQAVPINRI